MDDNAYKPAVVGTDGPVRPTIPPAAGPQQPAPRQRGNGPWRALAILAIILLLASFAVNILFVGFASLLGSGYVTTHQTPGAAIDQQLIRAGTSSDKIAILPIVGEIDAAMSTKVAAFCDNIQQDSDIKAVVLEIDSPGGGITASDEIYNDLMVLKRTRQLKIYVSMQSLTASGGYYISMAGDKLFAEPTTLTGSIGVIWPAFEVSRLLDKIGVTPEMIKSDQASEYKDAGSPFKPFTDADRAYIRGLVNQAHARFRSLVATSRGGKLHAPMADIAIGKIWTAQDALNLGLIDAIGYRSDVCDAIARDTGLVSPTIVRLGVRKSLFDFMGVSAGGITPKVSISITPEMLDQLRAPRMEYRWQP